MLSISLDLDDLCLSWLIVLVLHYSFDRHALELLEKMLTLDPAQVLFIKLIVTCPIYTLQIDFFDFASCYSISPLGF